MRRGILNFALILFGSALAFSSFATDFSAPKNGFELNGNTPVLKLPTPDLTEVHKENILRDANHQMYRIGIATTVNITPQNSGTWFTRENGDRVWQLEIDYPGAQSLSFLFERFILSGNSTFNAYSKKGEKLHTTFDSQEVLDHGQQNMELCLGDNMILELVEPKYTNPSEIYINSIHYNYRGLKTNSNEKINESDPCQVNARCSPEGNDYVDERQGVVRILVVEPGESGWCSGSVVNNTAKNCKPYVLTAFHCGMNSTTSNYNQFKFYFNYESPNCNNPTSVGSLANFSVTGCVKLADSDDAGGDTGSDFLLVQMGTIANEASTIAKIKGVNYHAYWNGWDATTTASPLGVSIHHPAGDIKKISTYSNTLISTSWLGLVANTHWRVFWASTTNGHGVTEGGSSGSPIFTFNNGNSRIVGTLTGGGSFCTQTNAPDAYGKMSYHWTSNGSATARQLKPFLDPNNTGLLVLNGSANPCSAVGISELEVLNEIKIYPNPTASILVVDLSEISENAEIYLYDMSGKLLLSFEHLDNALNELNISNLSTGMYHLVIKTNSAEITRKISKM